MSNLSNAICPSKLSRPIRDGAQIKVYLLIVRSVKQLTCPLFLALDQEGDGAVDSEAREEQGGCGKQRHHFHGEPPHRKRRGENVVQRLRAEDGKLRIGPRNSSNASSRVANRPPFAGLATKI
jgi:hypothetical protein